MRNLLDLPGLYRLWQAPFAAQKLRPVGDLARLRNARSVLEVACGPGNHAQLFDPTGYTGIDTNPGYIAHANERHAGRFLVADACDFDPPEAEGYELVFAGSFLHHLDDAAAKRALANLARLTRPDGRLVLMDLVLPEHTCPARLLARADRGDWPRPYERWLELFEPHFHTERVEPYKLRLLGMPLWHMIYFEGRPR